MRALVVALLLSAFAPAVSADPVQVVMPRAVLRATARRPGVVITLHRALLPPLPSGERDGVRGTFVDRITRSVNGERF